MRPIPIQMRAHLEKLPRMKSCAVKKLFIGEGCEGRIEWHHVWTYAGRQINEPWAIVGACTHHHEMVKKWFEMKNIFERASLMLANQEELDKYPRINWQQHLKRLGIQDLWQQEK